MQSPPHTLVIGCGNVLCGDDGAGPETIRRAEAGLSPGVACLDAATVGLAVLEAMRGVDRVIIVDACACAAEPGTVVVVPADEIPAVTAGRPLSLHAIRWTDAVVLARQLLGPAFPARCDAWLVAGAAFAPGDPRTPAVDAAIDRLVARLCGLRAAPVPLAVG